ncbi:MAG TPA: VWA domain-containing protein, partial [Balneolales bacterium]|nr:VWA domain-containing protein [Balneolales bacterium]
MIWENAGYLWFLTAIPLLAVGAWYIYHRTQKVREHYFKDNLFKDLYKTYWPLGSRLKNIALYIGIGFLTVALAGPKIGTQVRKVKQKGVDMIIALDLSSSMNCQDVSPSRLEKAKYEIDRLLTRLQGNRVGLVVFTGEAYLQSPLTMDFSALRMFLNVANTNQMPSTTTNFKAAMLATRNAFDDMDKQDKNDKAAKVMLIISDGENQGYDYHSALKSLQDDHIDVYTIGVGTQQGGAIPIYNSSGQLQGYKRDENGRVVTTHLQPKTLQQIAKEGDGKYYEIRRGSDSIDGFIHQIDKLQKG